MGNDCKVRLPLPVLVSVHLSDSVIPRQCCRNFGQLYTGNMLTGAGIVPLSPL